MKLRRFSLLLTIVISFIYGSAFSQAISPVFFGQNAWMPDTVGTKVLYGKLHTKWGDIKGSGAQIIRFGGIAPDESMPTNYQYIKMIDSVRARGMEPIIQVPYHKGQYTASQAAAIVKYINITKAKKIKYWIIANEPDLGYSYNASQIAPYIKSFASAMKAVDPTIKTIGPECAWYNHPIYDALTTPGGPYDVTGKDANGRYYIDIISFHTYPFNGTQTRSSVITKLTEAYSLSDNLAALNTKLANAANYHGRTSSPIKVAITEANVNYVNSSTDNLYGSGANSFIGGQFWAEMCGISLKHGVEFINFWSVLEGNNNELNIGYLDRSTGAKKPTYYHFQMMAQNLKGNYANGTDNQVNVKAFGSKNSSQIAVMVLNQDLASNFNYTVRLDKNAVSGTNALKVNIDAGIAKENIGVIAAQSSLMLVFDPSGNLIKKIEYKLSGHADANLAPTVTHFTVSATALTANVTPAGPVTFCTGGSVVLNANTGSGFIYQWKKDGVAITGATASSYTARATGSYQVKITSGTQNAWSAPLQVTVNAAPAATITASGSTAIVSGKSVILTANSGTGLTYQWRKNGVNISGATAVSYSANAAGAYTVIVKNATGCTATSAATNVTVSTTALTATVTPATATTFCTGGNVILKGNTGSGYIYQWKKDGVNITGATAANYTATTTGSYQLKVTSGTQNAWSAPLQVTVNPLPAATITASGSTTVAAGQSVTLTANSGTGFTYQWTKDGVNISGATAGSYKATATGNYFVIVKKPNGCSKTSAGTQVTVGSSAGLTAKITPSGSTAICATGGSVVLNANTGSGYYYTWKKNGYIISGATAASYTATTAGSYVVTIKSGTSTATSAGISVTTINLSATTSPAGTVTITSGGSVIIYASTGTGYVYQWKKDGVNISGATAASYKATAAGSYQVKITANGCNAWSAPVTVTVGSLAGRILMSGDSTAGAAGNIAPAGKGGELILTPEALKSIHPDSLVQIAARQRAGKKNDPKLAVGGKGNAKANSKKVEEEAGEEVLMGEEAVPFLIDTAFTVKAYPNPTDGPLNLQFHNPKGGSLVINLQVISLTGQIIINKTIDLQEEFGNDVIELANIASSGTYFLRITQNEQVENIKFIYTR